MAKKTFKDNPALQFINTVTDEYTDNTQNTDNTHNTPNTDIYYQERKSKRLNLLLQPSIFEDLSKIAYIKKTSVNDLINSILKGFAETETASVDKYNEIFPE